MCFNPAHEIVVIKKRLLNDIVKFYVKETGSSGGKTTKDIELKAFTLVESVPQILISLVHAIKDFFSVYLCVL